MISRVGTWRALRIACKPMAPCALSWGSRSITASANLATRVPQVGAQRSAFSTFPVLYKSGANKGGKKNKLKQPKHQPPPEEEEEDDDVAPQEFDVTPWKSAMANVVKKCDEMFGQYILASKSSQGQLGGLMVQTAAGKVPITEMGWSIKKQGAGNMYEVTTPGKEEADEAMASIKKDYPDLQISQTKAHLLVTFETVTGEYKEEIVQKTKGRKEKFRVQVRDVRQKALKSMAKAGLSKAEEKAIEKQIQTLHDQCIKKIDQIYTDKTKQIRSM